MAKNGIHSLLRRAAADARGSDDECDAYRYFAGQALLMMSHSCSHTEYLIPTYMVLD